MTGILAIMFLSGFTSLPPTGLSTDQGKSGNLKFGHCYQGEKHSILIKSGKIS